MTSMCQPPILKLKLTVNFLPYNKFCNFLPYNKFSVVAQTVKLYIHLLISIWFATSKTTRAHISFKDVRKKF